MSETSPSANERRTVKAVQFSCDIIEALRELNGAGVTEIANHLEVSKGAVHTHLVTLEANELVIKYDGQYRLSLRFIDLGEYVRNQIEFYDIVEEEVERLATDSGEVAQFMIEEHGCGVYIYKAEGENAIQTVSYVGNRNPLHCTALGKALLAHLPDKRVDEIFDKHGLSQVTSNTITDRDELLEQLDQVREQGIAFDREEIFKGIQCVAAPVLDQDGDPLGAVSVTGPISRMRNERLETEVAEMVKHTSNVIEINAAQV